MALAQVGKGDAAAAREQAHLMTPRSRISKRK